MDYRIYRRGDCEEWYLDGPSQRFPGIAFVEPPSIDRAKFGEVWANAAREYDALVAETKRQGRDTFGLDYQLIPLALALSSILQTRLLVVSGNDEDLDCGFICARGRVVRGRFLTGQDEAMVFDLEHGSRLEKLDWSEGHLLYEEAATIAADYFETSDAKRYAQSWDSGREVEYQVLEERRGLAIEQRGNRRLGCALLALVFVALLIGFQVAPSVANPISGVLLGLALLWFLLPVRK
ncbi:MAG: hypothetical protein NT015_16455 [Alphaproteobacteria bacterium]|nr:hypothetical protein [Alphaproteobacteria bacterium]